MAEMMRIEEGEQTPFYNRVATHLQQDSSKGYILNPGGAWMKFLSAYRRSHPRPHSLKEGAALVKAAGAAYRARVKRNPELAFEEQFSGKLGLGIPELREVSNQNILVAGVVAVGALWAYNKWVANR